MTKLLCVMVSDETKAKLDQLAEPGVYGSLATAIEASVKALEAYYNGGIAKVRWFKGAEDRGYAGEHLVTHRGNVFTPQEAD